MQRSNLCRRDWLAMCATGALSRTIATATAADAPVRGAGATFAAPLYLAWASIYGRQTGIDVSYEAIGSGAGLERLQRGLVDFAGLDVPLGTADLQRLGAIQFPTVIGGVVPVVNLHGIASGGLRLSGEVLANIYLGTIRRWNDAAIAGLNPEIDLPSQNITVVHRSDSSGTTFRWTEFLSRSSADWQRILGMAQRVAWPVGTSKSGNEGVASAVQRTRASIGYVEYTYARQHGLSLVSVRNHDGVFVAPSPHAFESAAMSAPWLRTEDLPQGLIDRSGADSWPITGTTLIVVPIRSADPRRAEQVTKFFGWALTEASRTAVALDYVAMPAGSVRLIGEVLSSRQVP